MVPAECGAAATEDSVTGALVPRLRAMAARLAAAQSEGPAGEVAVELAITGGCPSARAATILRAARVLLGQALRQGPAWAGGAVVLMLESEPDGRTALRIAHGHAAVAAPETAAALAAARRIAQVHGGRLRVHQGAVTTTELILPPPPDLLRAPAPVPPSPPWQARLARTERFEVTVISLVFLALTALMAAATLCQGAVSGWGVTVAPPRALCLGGMLLAGTRCPPTG